MKIRITLGRLALFSILVQPLSPAHAQSTAFTYQGRLDDGPNPATGSYDLRFGVFNDDNGGVSQGGWLTNSATAVTNGLFTVTLDFGNQFPGAPRWIELGVRTNGGGAFTTLVPRQRLTATPYAVTAGTISGALPAGQITGTVPLSQLPTAVVTNGASGVNISGTFTGSGAGLTEVNLALNSGGAMSWPGNFVPASSPALGFGPYVVVAADVNGDGKPDLIGANGNASSLMVLTNSGAGGFVLASSPGVGTGPQALTAADVNGDGKLDLISANFFDNTLTVLTNNGSGGFAPASSPPVGVEPISVTAADVNGDGKPDLISANSDANTLTVLTNSGAGGFVLASSPNVGTLPQVVTSADVNGDGKSDLISANFNANTLTVLTNSGSGSFGLASSPAVGINPFSVTAADVNGDGKPDLISANLNASTLTVLTNNGSGSFLPASSPAVGDGPLSVTSADVNGDGKLDLVSASFRSNTLTVLTNNGRGGFALASLLDVGRQPSSVTSADVNGDGRPDLISADYGDYSLTVLFNTATFTGSFAGNGSGLTSIQAGSLTGTLADARLSANVALRAGGNAFTGNQTIAGNVGIGLSSPAYSLDVQSGLAVGRFTTTNNGNGAVLALRNTTASPTYLGAINFEDAGGTPGQIGYLASGQMTFRVDGVDRMSITPTGLNVNGAASATALSAFEASAANLISTDLLQTHRSTQSDSHTFTGSLRQMLSLAPATLFGPDGPGLGLQTNNLYFRSQSDFSWFRRGTHRDTPFDPGASLFEAGVEMMRLATTGLTVNGAFIGASDRNLKENFAPVQPRDILEKVAALPITSWNYKQDTASRHVGPMAQDFYAAFGIGPDDKHIATVDADGVALAAIKGLNEKVESGKQKAEIQIGELKAENTQLKARLEKLERLLEPKFTGGAQ